MLGTFDEGYQGTETFEETKQRRRVEKKQRHVENQKEALDDWNPNEDTEVRGDPYKTLFIARMSYELTKEDLEKEFAPFGKIERIRIVHSTKDDKPRGYAFIVYDREKDMRAALDRTDGIKIKGHRILVDVERGRTVKSWKPMRLGGGKGGRKAPGKSQVRDSYPSTSQGQSRDHTERSSARPTNGYSSAPRDDYARERSAPRPDRNERSERYDRSDRSDRDRHERVPSQAPRNHGPPPSNDRYADRSRQGRQGIGFDRPIDLRASTSRSYQDSPVGFAPASQQALDPRARQPPTTYATPGMSSAPSAPWLASSSSAAPSNSRDRPSHDDDRDRDYKRRRY